MLKYNDKEGIGIKGKKFIYVLTAVGVIALGAWFLQDASDNQNSQNENTDHIADVAPKEELKNEQIAPLEPAVEDAVQKTEEFKLKDENEYIQLRLSVTSAEGEKESVEKYLKNHLDVNATEDYSGNIVLSSPKDEYDLALSTIIDCPYTENVLYKNEDYYPVACEIYDKSFEDGKISSQAAEYIENIEEMCKNIIIVIN